MLPGYWHWVALATVIIWAVVFRVRATWRTHVAVCLVLAWVAALFSWSVSLDPARGTVSGRVVSAKTRQPLIKARVYMPGGDAWVRTDDEGNFRLSGVEVGKHVRITARARGYETSYDEVEVKEAKETSGVVFRMSPRPPTFNLYNSQRVFRPTEAPQINLSGTMSPDIVIGLYKLDARKDRAAVLDPLKRQALGQRLGKEENTIYETRFSPELDPDGEFSGSVNLPEQEPGLYFVLAMAEGGKQIRNSWFLVTDLALVTRRSPHEILVYAQNFATGLPVGGAALEFYDGDKPVKKATTRPDGTFLWTEPGGGALALLGEAGGSYAYSRLDGRGGDDRREKYRLYVYSERPIYRPTHEVHIRGIVRQDQDRVYSIPAGQNVTVLVEDPKGAPLVTQTVKVSDFGGFQADLTLPANAVLGDYNVTATLEHVSGHGSFKVAEYRKPEFKVDLAAEKRFYTSGDKVRVKVDARYFFGSPVTAAKVRWSVYESYYHFDRTMFYDVDGDSSPEHYGGMTADGTLRLADDGTAWIEFTPSKATHDRDFWVDVEVEDPSHRTVSASTDVLVTLGDYWIDARTDRWGYNPGEAVNVTVATRDYEGDKPRPDTKVHGALQRIDYVEKTEKEVSHYERVEHEVWTQDGVTNSKGELTWAVTPPSDGSYQMLLTSQDALGNTITSTAWFFVSGGDRTTQVYGGRDLTLLLDKPKYAPDSTAHVVITSRVKDASVLLCVDGRRIHSYQVVQLKGTSASVTLPVKREYFPNVTISAIAIRNKELLTDDRPLVVDTADRGLDIQITPDKAVYEPGQDLHCKIHIVDKSGKPVEAEFSLGVVDAAIYALAPDTTQKIYEFFYGTEPSYVRTEYSFAPDYSGGRNKDDDPRVRRNFKDTAYWAPMLKTDANGDAEVSFPLPDNLTAWRFTVRAITKDHRVGEATREVTSRKPLLVRLEVPRFMVERDQMELSGVVHNETEQNQDVEVEMKVEGLELKSAATQHKSMGPHSVQRFAWTVVAPKVGTAKVSVMAKGQKTGDAMELTFPILPHGVAQLQTGAGEASPSASWKVTVPKDSGNRHLTVYLSPSLAAAAMQGLDYLATYPYGCVEQTMSAFLPDIVVSRALRDLGISDAKLQQKLPDMVSKGLGKLYDMQHADGGWGWWKDDATNPYLTAYVVCGLYQARQAGYEVRDSVYTRGVAALKKLASEDVGEFQEASGEVMQRTMWSVKAYEVRVLALIADPQKPDKKFDVHALALAVDRHQDELNVFTQALLAEALWRVGEKARAEALLEKIRGQVIETETSAHWDTKTISYSWVDDPVEATSAVLRTMLLVDPKSPQIDRVVRWLVAYRKGACWDSTRGTAAVIDVLTELLLARREALKGDYEAEVTVNGKPAGRVAVKGALLGVAGVIQVDPSLLVDGENEVLIKRSNAGTLYWSAALETFATTENIAAEDKGLQLTRNYAVVSVQKDDKGKPSVTLQPLAAGTAVPIGSRIRVTVTVKNTKPYNYVLIEDKLIPGCELVEAEGSRNSQGGWWWVGREVHDDRLSVFVSRLEAGEHKLEYDVRAEAPGTYHVRPAESYLMYTPEVRGYSAESTFTVSTATVQP